jgi:HD-GYP domain-containing protein (c-di-GMP phosphodiesterase class II)
MAMVKLSEIIRKIPEIKGQDVRPQISEAVKPKGSVESLADIKKIYENSILLTKIMMQDLRRGESVEGEEVIDMAETLIAKIRSSNNLLLSLINIFAFYNEKEDFIHIHSINVAILAACIGIALEYEEDTLIDLCASALLHDIGMLKIPLQVITKPSKLDKEEEKMIKEHPLYGLELLRNVKNAPKSAAMVIHQHHEKMDGTGYPEGKKGEDIAECARIVAILEVYEALTHPRPYRRSKFIPYDAVRMIIQEGKSSFDLELVKIFLNLITPYPVGSFILLNNGEIGRVIAVNEGLALRPVVEVYFDKEGKPPEKPTKIDLTKSSILYIEKAIDENDL